MSEAFALHRVSRGFSGFRLQIDQLQMARGYVLGLVGRNGAGKSTTIKILTNLVYPDAGEVSVLGLRQPADELAIKRRIGYLGENPAFYEQVTVGWLAGLVSRYYPTWDDALYRSYLGKFGLAAGKRVRELSRGMKVKLGLTLALAHRPELLILDEPTSGLDPVVRRELLAEIAEIVQDERRTVLFSSHITGDVEQIADFVAILEEGRLVEFADREALFDRAKRVSGTLGGGGVGDLTADALAGLFSEIEVRGTEFTGVTRDFSAAWLDRLKARGAADLKVADVSLEDILVSLTGKGSERDVAAGE